MSLTECHTVLVVEDDLHAQSAMRFALQDMHRLDVRICSGAREALQAAEDFPADLLLLDVKMPEIDGATLLAGLRQLPLHHSTPVIFVTASVDPDDMRYYRSLGVAGVIAKPFDPLQLGQRIADILAQHAEDEVAAPALTRELDALHRVFESELPQRLSRIRDLLQRCRSGPVTRPDCAQLWELIEDLRSSAARYGHHQMAIDAQRIGQSAASLVLSPSRSARELVAIEDDLMRWSVY